MSVLPEPSFRSSWPDDEHAFCLCGGLMSFNACSGQLECDDCETAADDAAVIVARVVQP